MARIGFLGLGTMGTAMATRLVEAGHEVVVWNRSSAAVDKLVAHGAAAATTAAEALAAGPSFSMLANDHAADEVLSEDNLRNVSSFHVNMASVSPACAKKLSERASGLDVAYLAAPVLGRPAVAEAGKLNILAGGPANTIAAAQEFFDVMGVRTWPMGDAPEVANLVKVAVNYNIIHALQALSESVALVENSGVAASDFVELLSNTLFGGVVHQGYGNIIASRQYLPAGFTLELGLKDLSLAEGAARENGTSLPSAPVLREVFEKALADPKLAGYDWAAIAEVVRDASA